MSENRFDFDCMISWEDFEKVVGEKAVNLKERCDSFLVYLSIGSERITFNDLCCMFVEDLFGYFFDTQNGHFAAHDYLEIEKLKQAFNNCCDEFKEKVGIPVYMDTSLSVEDLSVSTYLCLDVLEVTVKGFCYKEDYREKLDRLKDLGISFDLNVEKIV